MQSAVLSSLMRFGVAAALLVSAHAAHAIASCSAQAVGPGDNCGLGKPYAVSPETQTVGTHVITTGSASVDLPTGALRGAIRMTDGPAPGGTGAANASFAASLVVDFRILGPAGAPSVPVQMISALGGNLSATCTWPGCEGSLGYSVRLDSVSFSGFEAKASGVTTLVQPWLYSSSADDNSGRNLVPVASHTPASDGGSFMFAFDAAQAVGHTLRATIDLSANLYLHGAPDGTVMAADASHTALFNVLVPAGYSVDAFGVDLLTQPLLVPEPPSALLALAGAAIIGVRRRARSVPRLG
jgi:hypothetical protein